MQLTFEIDDKLAEQFFNTTPQDEQKSAFTEMFTNYLKSKFVKPKENDELEFVGMWKDREMDVNEFIRQSRQGRYFNDN